MSWEEYSNLLFEISRQLDQLNVREQLHFMCRGKVVSGIEDINNVLSLFRELEDQDHLEIDRLEVLKELLKGVREWSLFQKVKKFEVKRKEYNCLLRHISGVLDEHNHLERLILICRRKTSVEIEGNIHDVRSLFKELERQNFLGFARLEFLKEILTEIEEEDLLRKVQDFERRRNEEDEFERRKARASDIVGSARAVGGRLIGVLNMKTMCRVAAAGITLLTVREVLTRWSTYDQLVNCFNDCVLPAGTHLIEVSQGCVCFTVQADNLTGLTSLWDMYQNGTLKARLRDFFVTDEMEKRAGGGGNVEVTVTIEEEEYEKACTDFINEAEGKESPSERANRRRSDSVLYVIPKEDEMSLIKLKKLENKFNILQERMEIIEKEIEKPPPEFLETRSAKEKITSSEGVYEAQRESRDPNLAETKLKTAISEEEYVAGKVYIEEDSPRDLLGYVKRLLGVEGAIFNLKPIAEMIGTSEETMSKVIKSWRNLNDQLELLMEPWLKDTDETKDFNSLRRSLEELKEEDYKVTQRGQMHIKHLIELAVKISDLKIENAELMKYFTGKVQRLCGEVLRDCCIQVANSVEDVERGASSEDYVYYLEVHEKVSPETASKFQQMYSSSEESIVKSFLAIVPQLIQDVKVIFRDEIMPDVQNGLRGLNNDALNELASSVREAGENNKIRKLVCEVCKILENLCVKNCDSRHSAELIHKLGSSLGVLPMLDLLKPFFQTCPQHIRLHKRLELFTCRIRGIISDEVDVDEVFMRDFFDVSSSLIQFAKFDPTKLVRFQLLDSANSPVTCKGEGVKYDSHNDTFSELFMWKEEKEELLLHAVARVHTKGQVCNIGAFQSVIMLPASMEKGFESCMAGMTPVTAPLAWAKQEVKDSQTVRVVLCSPEKERLALLLHKLRSGELQDVVDWKGSQITPCHLTIRTFRKKPTNRLSLRLIYKWESETLSFKSENFVLSADSSAESVCIAEVRFEGLKGPVKPEEVALSFLTSDDGHFPTEPFGSQRTQIHAQKIEYKLYQTNVTGHSCMIGDRTTLNTQTSTDEQRSLPPGPSSAPLRSLTDHTTEHDSTSSEE